MQTGKFREYNPNPSGKRVGDCAVRALCKATGMSWDDVFNTLTSIAFYRKDMPSANRIWGEFLKHQGFARVPSAAYTVEEFCEYHPDGVYVLALNGHVTCIEDGILYDTWDCGDEEVVYCWTRT